MVLEKSVDLVWRARTPNGWQRFPVVIGRNGRIKKGSVIIDGREHSFPNGHFLLRYYEDRKTRYTNVGTDTTEAVNARDRLQNLQGARTAAAVAGVSVNEPETRKTIKREAARYVQAAKDRDHNEVAEVNELALLEFRAANPRLQFVDEITPDALTTFWRFLKKHRRSDRTIHNKHSRIIGFLKFAGVEYRKWSLKAPRYERTLPNIYSQDELNRLLKACKHEYQRITILLLAKTGLRDQELQHLTWSDIKLHDNKLRVIGKPEYKWSIKTWEQRDIPLTPELVAGLKKWREEHPKAKLVLGTRNDKPNTKLLLMLKPIAKRAGIEDATLHRFRRTFATMLLRGGMDLRTVQMLMGHHELQSTMRYLAPATGDEVRAKIDSILG